MKTAIKKLLTIDKIIDIVLLFIFALSGLILVIVGLIIFLQTNPQGIDDVQNELVYIFLPVGFSLVFVSPLFVVALIFNHLAHNIFISAKHKNEARKAGIFAIIAGIIGFMLSLVAGILILTMNEDEFAIDF